MEHLYILWANGDELTFDKMVSMYARNSKLEYWWDQVTVIIWGSPAKIAAESEIVRMRITELLHVGVHITACKACADQLGVTDPLSEMGIEVRYLGEELTRIIKDREYLITI